MTSRWCGPSRPSRRATSPGAGRSRRTSGAAARCFDEWRKTPRGSPTRCSRGRRLARQCLRRDARQRRLAAGRDDAAVVVRAVLVQVVVVASLRRRRTVDVAGRADGSVAVLREELRASVHVDLSRLALALARAGGGAERPAGGDDALEVRRGAAAAGGNGQHDTKKTQTAHCGAPSGGIKSRNTTPDAALVGPPQEGAWDFGSPAPGRLDS